MNEINLFKQFVLTRQVRAPFNFGINENVIIAKIDTGERKHKETVINANTFITFHKLDKDGKVIAVHESSFWNLDPTQQNSNIAKNIGDQFTTMSAMILAIGKSDEDFENDITAIPDLGKDESLDEYASTKAKAKIVQDKMQSVFVEYMSDHLGKKCPKLKCKLISNKKGYLNLSREINWIVPMDGEVAEVTDTEALVYQKATADSKSKATKQVQPDTVTSGEKKVTKGSPFNSTF